MRTFIDTNVLIYADNNAEHVKMRRAQEALKALFKRREGVVSTQVLQEYFVNATRKLGLSSEMARARVERLSGRMNVVVIDPAMVLAAADLHRLRQISFWDALIIRAAAAGGCSRLLTEDLSHGETYEGVTVENPFR